MSQNTSPKRKILFCLGILLILCALVCTIIFVQPFTENEAHSDFLHRLRPDESTILSVQLQSLYEHGKLQEKKIVGLENFDEVCAALDKLKISARPISQDGIIEAGKTISIATADKGQVDIGFNHALTEVYIPSSKESLAVYKVRNPEVLRPLFMISATTDYINSKMIEKLFLETELGHSANEFVVLSPTAPSYNSRIAILKETGEHNTTAYFVQYAYTEEGVHHLLNVSKGLISADDSTLSLNLVDGKYPILWGVLPYERLASEANADELPTISISTTNRNEEIPVYGGVFVAHLSKNASITDIRCSDGTPVTVYPSASTSVIPPMDESFIGYEALYDAIIHNSQLDIQLWSNMQLIGCQSIDDNMYTILKHKYHDDFLSDYCVLVEYEANANGSITILEVTAGLPAENMSHYGYLMNQATFQDKAIYWTTLAQERWSTTADNKTIDASKTAPMDYTSFRFMWADSREQDFLIQGNIFIAEINSVIHPAIVYPMVGTDTITALGYSLS